MRELFWYVTCFAKVFLLLFFFSQTWYFIIKELFRNTYQVRYCHFFIIEIVVKVWIWYRCQNRIENDYHHDGDQLAFYKNVLIKTQQKEGCSCNPYFAWNEEFQFIWQKMYCIQDNVKCHIQRKESWLRWVLTG